jgi:hypothetical protein
MIVESVYQGITYPSRETVLDIGPGMKNSIIGGADG